MKRQTPPTPSNTSNSSQKRQKTTSSSSAPSSSPVLSKSQGSSQKTEQGSTSDVSNPIASIYTPLPPTQIPAGSQKDFSPQTFTTQTLLPSTSKQSLSQNISTYESKLKQKTIHLENPVPDAIDRERRAQEKVWRVGGLKQDEVELKGGSVKKPNTGRRKRKKMLTSRERKLAGVYDIPAEARKYSLFVPLHQLWTQYMTDLLSDCLDNTEQFLSKIVKADYHGGVFTVTQAKCKNYVGISGIMVKETENVFYLMTKGDELKAVPKTKCNFAFEVLGKLVTLFGSHLKGRAADRSAKKFKEALTAPFTRLIQTKASLESTRSTLRSTLLTLSDIQSQHSSIQKKLAEALESWKMNKEVLDLDSKVPVPLRLAGDETEKSSLEKAVMKEIQCWEGKVKELEAQLREVEAQKEGLEVDVKRLEGVCRDLERQMEAAKERVRGELEAAAGGLGDLKSLKKEKEEAVEEKKRLEELVEVLQKEIEVRVREGKKDEEAARMTLQKAEERIADSEEKVKESVKRVQDLELESALIADMNERLQEELKQARRASTPHDSHSATIEKTSTQNNQPHISDHADLLQQLTTENDELAEKLGHLESQLRSRDTDVHDLREELHTLHDARLKDFSERSNLLNRIEALQKELAAIKRSPRPAPLEIGVVGSITPVESSSASTSASETEDSESEAKSPTSPGSVSSKKLKMPKFLRNLSTPSLPPLPFSKRRSPRTSTTSPTSPTQPTSTLSPPQIQTTSTTPPPIAIQITPPTPLTPTHSHLHQDLQKLQEDLSDSLEAQMKAKEECKVLRERLKVSEDALGNLEKVWKGRVERWKGVVESRGSLNDLSAEKREKVDASEVQKLESQLLEADANLQTLQSMNAKLSIQLSELQNQHEEQASIQSMLLDQAEKMIEKLKTKLAKAKTSTSEAGSSQEDTEGLLKVKSTSGKLRDALDKQCVLTRELEVAKEKATKFEKLYNDLQKATPPSSEELRSTIIHLQSTLEALKAENESLERKIASEPESPESTLPLLTKLQTLESENGELRTQLRVLQTSSATLQRALDALTTGSSKVDGVPGFNVDSSCPTATTEGQDAQLRQCMDDLKECKDIISNREEEIVDLREWLSDAEKEMERKDAELAKILGILEEKEAEIERLSEGGSVGAQGLLTEIDELRGQVRELSLIKERFESQTVELETLRVRHEKKEHLENLLYERKQQVQHLEELLQEKENQIQRLQHEIKDYQQQLQSMQSSVGSRGLSAPPSPSPNLKSGQGSSRSRNTSMLPVSRARKNGEMLLLPSEENLTVKVKGISRTGMPQSPSPMSSTSGTSSDSDSTAIMSSNSSHHNASDLDKGEMSSFDVQNLRYLKSTYTMLVAILIIL
ncbi:RNase P/RNase MRP complex subunit [Chytridiales sp. JEL 0842]|nr:RNase P/RNase MRP complex subunit [Chytridiales sp. JEL 0842]